MRVTLLLSLISLVCFAPRPAEAFVCTRINDDGTTQAWLSRCVPYTISCLNDLLLSDHAREVIERSFARWSAPDCTDFVFMPVGYEPELTDFSLQSPRSNRNTIAIHDDPDIDLFPDDKLVALTFTHFSLDTGEILDADIVLNGARFNFAMSDSCDPSDNKTFDFENTLVHEIGHFIGFDHTPVMDATMFASAEPCETVKRDLADDDVSAICAVYPNNQAVQTCQPPPGGYAPDGLDLTAFRNQCDRLSSANEQLTEAQCVARRGGGGCSCDTAQDAAPRSESGSLGMLLLFCGLAALRRRASGR